jgi:hypothetical protein
MCSAAHRHTGGSVALIWKQNDLSPCHYNSIFSVLARTSIRPDPMDMPMAKPEYGILEYPTAV